MSFSKFADFNDTAKRMGVLGGLGAIGGGLMEDATRAGRKGMQSVARPERWKTRGVNALGYGAIGLGAGALSSAGRQMHNFAEKKHDMRQYKKNRMSYEEKKAQQEEIDRQAKFPWSPDKEDEVLDEFQRQAIEKGRYDGPTFDNLTSFNHEVFPYELNDETAQLVQKYPRLVEAMKKDTRRDRGGLMFSFEEEDPERQEKLYDVTTKLLDEGRFYGYKGQLTDEQMDNILNEDFNKQASFSKFADSKFRPKEMGIAGGLGLLGGAAMNDVTRRGRSAMKNMPRADRWKARGVSGAALGIGAAGLTDWSLSMKDSVNKHKERKERKQNRMTPEERRAYQEEVDRQSQFPYQRDKEDEVLDEFQRQAIEKGRYDGPKFDNLTLYNVEQFPYELNDETAQLVQKYPRIVEAMKKDNRRDFGGVMLDFNLEKDNPERLDKLYRVTTKLMDEGLYGGYKRQMSDEEMDNILNEDFNKQASFSKFANEQRIDQYVRQAGAEEGKVKGMLGGGLLGAGTGALGGGTAATYLNRIKRGPNTPRNVAGGALATLAGVGGAYLGGKKGGEVGELAGAEQKMRQYDGMLREAGVNPQLLHRYVGLSKQDAVNEGKRFGTLAEQNQWMNKDEREKKASHLDQRMLKLANADQLDDAK